MVMTEAIAVLDLRQQRSDHLGITGSSFSGGAAFSGWRNANSVRRWPNMANGGPLSV